MHLPPSHANTSLSCLQFRFGLRRQLGIALAAPGATCQCQKGLSTSRPYVCGAELDAYGHHALRCVKAVHTKRHDKVKQIISQYAITAGLQSKVEQCLADATEEPAQLDVALQGSSHVRRPLLRADIFLSNLDGLQRWMDVRITAPPYDNNILYHLRQAEGTKERQYAVPGVVPIIFSTSGHLAPKGHAALSWLVEQRVRKLQEDTQINLWELRSQAAKELYGPISCVLLRAAYQCLEYATFGAAGCHDPTPTPLGSNSATVGNTVPAVPADPPDALLASSLQEGAMPAAWSSTAADDILPGAERAE